MMNLQYCDLASDRNKIWIRMYKVIPNAFIILFLTFTDHYCQGYYGKYFFILFYSIIFHLNK